MDLSVEVGSEIVVDNHGAHVILGRGFYNKDIRDIRPCRWVFDIDDGITVLILMYVITQSRFRAPISEAQIYSKEAKLSTKRLVTAKRLHWNPKAKLG